MMQTIKVRGGPDFYNIKKAEWSKNQEECWKINCTDKTPGDEHSNDLINYNPLRIVQLVFFLDMLRDQNWGHEEDNNQTN